MAASKIVLPAGSNKLGRVVVAWVVAVGLAITLAAIIPAVFVPDSLQNKSANEFTKESSSQQCVALEASSGLIVADLSEFAIVGWSVSTFGEMKKIGSIWFTSFEAKCQLQTIVGRVTANSRESGFQLLSLSTSYIFG